MKTHTILANHSDWVVVDKEPGVLSVPPRFPDKDSRPVLGRILERELQCQIFPVHRLDFEVSGLLIFAKSSEAQKKLNQSFEKRSAQKTYEALVASSPPVPSTTWKNKIVRGKKRSFYAPHGQESLTVLQSVSRVLKSPFWRLLLEPKTGRPHQLRLDCAQNVSPIVGDKLYGSPFDLGETCLGLRAIKLELPEISPIAFEIPSRLDDWLKRFQSFNSITGFE